MSYLYFCFSCGEELVLDKRKKFVYCPNCSSLMIPRAKIYKEKNNGKLWKLVLLPLDKQDLEDFLKPVVIETKYKL